MVIPMFKEEYENKTIQELVKDRQALINRMKKYEDEYILEKKKSKLEVTIIISPSPDVLWSVDNENLIMLTQLIEEKRLNE